MARSFIFLGDGRLSMGSRGPAGTDLLVVGPTKMEQYRACILGIVANFATPNTPPSESYLPR